MKASGAAKPMWFAVNDEALINTANIARVMAGMGFITPLDTVSRGAIVWWQPDYLRSGPKTPSSHRAAMALVNQAMRDSDVLVMLDKLYQVIAVDTYDGEWRTSDGSQRGDDLISLGMLRWSCSYGHAASRIARLIGLRSIPKG
ncbi:hypothetical protein [Falsiroseomonas sp. E2-1-a20]|uniref:hypothetical protein n=1 Tax=Falsiroseomonas sp. E2-1-a20 TaxID=3239300 RepID=UPI003F59E7B2